MCEKKECGFPAGNSRWADEWKLRVDG